MRFGELLARMAMTVLGALVLCDAQAWAQTPDLRSLYTGARARAMGGAFTGLADDEQAIFINPAGLAQVPDYRLTYLNLDVLASTDIYSTYTESRDLFQNFGDDTVNALLGKNIFARAQYTPSLLAAGFGVAAIVDYQGGLLARNPVFPTVQLGFQTTSGVQVAYGVSVLGRRGRSKAGRHDLRVGVAAKYLTRKGGFPTFDLLDLVNIDRAVVSNRLGPAGTGYGLDLGVHYAWRLSSNFEVMAGAAYNNIGDIAFRPPGNVAGTIRPDPIFANLRAGVATRYKTRGVSASWAFDLQNLNISTDWRKRVRTGAEVSIPLFTFAAGLSQFYPTYGVTVDLLVARFTLLSFKEEFGVVLRQSPARVYQLNCTLGLGI